MAGNRDYDFLTVNEQKTVRLFGRTYHWERDADGVLHLEPGMSPSDPQTTEAIFGLPKGTVKP